MSAKWVYMFKEGNPTDKNLLGGKGANLADMTRLGLPIPQGFTVTTEACTAYYENGRALLPAIEKQIDESIQALEVLTNKKFGDPTNPLLVSVRSGARVSMPGMMDTVLNLGLNDASVKGLAAKTGNERFAYDCYRRFIQMFSDVVMEIEKSIFEKTLEALKEEKQVTLDTELDTEALQTLVQSFKALYKQKKGEDFPQDPQVQLMETVKAVFRSWMNQRAIVYRRMNGYPAEWGTAVNVQMMVFGNMGNTSGTGVAFTRNPATGERAIYGEYLINAQGEDVVAGIRTPSPIAQLQEDMPEVYEQFVSIANTLEQHYRDMQDMEFTVEEGKLYFLQTRNGKRTAAAALRIAVELVREEMITQQEAILRVEPKQLDQLLHPMFDQVSRAKARIIGKGLAASPGAATGKIYFSAESAKAAKERGEKVILVRLETSPEDIEGMAASEGILTVRGGMTSHAAVVARGMGTCCVSGCGDIEMHEEEKYFVLDNTTYKEGDCISLDGSSGIIYGDAIQTVAPELTGDFEVFMEWADSYRTMKVRTNADSPKDAMQAVKFGAEGIGLCRTEHMFFEESRIMKVRKMIVAKTEGERKVALAALLPLQKSDFVGIYETMQERPVTVRLLDPPLHEFLPQTEEEIVTLAEDMAIPTGTLKATVDALHEFNPMMGHRGCRLAVSYPEIAEMQTTAIIEAALQVKATKGYRIVPEIMIPLIGDVKELKYVKKIVTQAADAAILKSGMTLDYHIGTMIEIPRAALTADEIAKEAAFFSFGTNDLTQMTFGFSRDDAGKFLDAYYQKAIYECDPFATIDQTGVGELIQLAAQKGRQTRPEIKLGICGEHGGDPASIAYCQKIGLNYVSCSPYRVPIARLAAAQAAINNACH